MTETWEKYDCHPEIGPLIEEYRYQLRDIELVKRGLRTQDNIASIMRLSREAAETKREILGLMDREEALLADRKRETLWIAVTFAAVIVGIVNGLIALHLF
jgi:hypothetical protein